MRARAAFLTPRLGALVLTAALAGCSHRERANPFDPANPSTRGRPVDFVAFAGDQIVTLRWSAVDAPGLQGYQLYRRVPPDTAFTPLADRGSPADGEYQDFGLLNGVRHEYRLYYVFDGAPAGTPAEASAVPGPLRPWVVDFGNHALLRLTPDGQYVSATDADFAGPAFVAVDPSDGGLWVTDTYRAALVHYADGRRTEIDFGFARPTALAVSAASHVAWVCDEGHDQVLPFGRLGLPADPPAVALTVQTPVAVAIDPRDGTIWVCERATDRVRHFTASGCDLGATPLRSPSRVAVDSLTQEAWATSFDAGQVIRIAGNGTARDTIALAGPIGIAVDARRGRVWVADALAGAVVALDRNGTVQFRVGGLREVREIAVDPATGDAWATVPGASQVARISSAGQILRILRGLGEPFGIALDPGH